MTDQSAPGNAAPEAVSPGPVPKSQPSVKCRSYKDLAEHIRSIHFALAGLCVALWLILLSPTLNTGKAIVQGSQIKELLARWPEVQTEIWNAALTASKFPQPYKWRDVAYVTEACAQPQCTQTPTHYCVPTMCRTILNGAVTVDEATLRSDASWFVLSAGLNRKPANLMEFRLWWNTLHSNGMIGLPDFKSIHHITASDETDLDGAWAAKGVNVTTSHAYPVNGEQVPRPTDITTDAEAPDLMTVFTPAFQSNRFRISASKPDKDGFTARLSYDGDMKYVRIDEGVLNARFFTAQHLGDYDHAFEDLSKTAVSIEDLDLTTVLSELSKTQAASDHVVEVFGIKIASDEINRWGLVFLLAIQLYLWALVSLIPPVLDAENGIWEVAWIGLYRSAPALCFTVISIGVAPVATCILLSRRIAVDHHWSAVQIVVVVFALGISSVLSFLTVRRLRTLPLETLI